VIIIILVVVRRADPKHDAAMVCRKPICGESTELLVYPNQPRND